MRAVCRLTDKLARFSPESASSKWPNPRSVGRASVHDPARPAITTVASGATNTTNTTTANPMRMAALLRRLHNNIGDPPSATAHQPREHQAVQPVKHQRQRDLNRGDHRRTG